MHCSLALYARGWTDTSTFRNSFRFPAPRVEGAGPSNAVVRLKSSKFLKSVWDHSPKRNCRSSGRLAGSRGQIIQGQIQFQNVNSRLTADTDNGILGGVLNRLLNHGDVKVTGFGDSRRL